MKCHFCLKDGADVPVSDDEGNAFFICDECDDRAGWEAEKTIKKAFFEMPSYEFKDTGWEK